MFIHLESTKYRREEFLALLPSLIVAFNNMHETCEQYSLSSIPYLLYLTKILPCVILQQELCRLMQSFAIMTVDEVLMVECHYKKRTWEKTQITNIQSTTILISIFKNLNIILVKFLNAYEFGFDVFRLWILRLEIYLYYTTRCMTPLALEEVI